MAENQRLAKKVKFFVYFFALLFGRVKNSPYLCNVKMKRQSVL